MRVNSYSSMVPVALLSTLLTSALALPTSFQTPDPSKTIIMDQAVLNRFKLNNTRGRFQEWNARNFHNDPERRAKVVEKRTVAAASGISPPVVASTNYLGPTVNNPSEYYLSPIPAGPALPTFTSGSPYFTLDLDVSGPLATNFPMSNYSGTYNLDASNEKNLYKLGDTPSISRDAGIGGTIGNTKIFIFSDTEVFSQPSYLMESFTSNSVSMDYGFNAANGVAPSLRDGVGQWASEWGSQRGFIPFTTGETEYNIAMNSHNGRIAIWPSSPITPLSDGVAIQWAPIVLVSTLNGVSFNQVGITMYEISVPNARSGPSVNRVAPYLFGSGVSSWGCLGGTRSWGASGVGGTDGWVWAFAENAQGLLAARVPADSVADPTAYQYWVTSKQAWSSTMTDETFLNGSYTASSIFYSPYHKTFINVYADRYVDNQILWRYLEVPEGGITPQYDGEDFVGKIVQYPWSDTFTLFSAPVPGDGSWIYSSGPNLGYFEDDDITNGGTKLLLTWTAPTGQGAGTAETSYKIPAVVIDWA